MHGLVLLKQLAQTASGEVNVEVMPPRLVRFTLEYPGIPDPAAERVKVAALTGADQFSLDRLADVTSGRAAHFLVLQFPGVERNFSNHALYEMAGALRDGLGLISCEPDIGARIYGEPDAPVELSQPESAIVDLWCSSDAAAPTDKLWALKSINAPKAWTLSPKQGEGILVAQPDTGVAAHRELETGALELGKAKNLLEGGTNPTDPLSPNVANPGHGTATSSVVISRPGGLMTGSAPAARLVPIRCINDVKIFDGAPIAASVAHARKEKCDIVTMSLGGIYVSALAAAIADAVESGMIVLAAAGNCIGFVVYPAYDPNVIAVAGLDSKDRPWKGTSAGAAVDISAPGENVYVARRLPGDGRTDEVSGGQGTSYAVALTAGVAALWLSHHGREAVRSEAERRNASVQAVFRAALRQTARRPAKWDSGRYGAGIVDAAALLDLKLSDIIKIDDAIVEGTGDLEKIARLTTERAAVEGFDWARHGAEASHLAAEAAIVARRAALGIESLADGVLRPSEEVLRTAPAILQRMFGRAAAAGPASSVIRATANLSRVLKLVGREIGGGVESASAVTVEEAQRRLRGNLSSILVAKLDTALGNMPTETAGIQSERKRIVQDAETALSKLAAAGPEASLSARERISVEALINIHDRPALRVTGNDINKNDPLLGDWAGTLLPAAPLIKPVLEAVGRIDLGTTHIGTGFVVAPGRVMTNRHVLEEIAEEFRTTNGSSAWTFTGAVTINFADDGRGDAKRFKIKGVIAAGPNRINRQVDFRNLDMAVLEVETTNAENTPLPTRLPVVDDLSFAHKGREILVAGYPARPGANAIRDPVTGLIRDDIVARLGQIFGVAYSVKYLSPGEIDIGLGQLPEDKSYSWVFAHDATTLGGNSGSWAINLGDPFGVIGLHFGGGTLRANYAHSIRSVRDAKILAAAGLDGTQWI